MEQLLTRWGRELDKNCPLNDYPRPQMERDSFICLNGEWDYAIYPTADAFSGYEGKITVPFSPETLLSGVIGMVKKLGMKVTQEGVETKEDLLRLEALGCEVIQGYYFSKPLKYVDYLQFIETNFINRQQ